MSVDAGSSSNVQQVQSSSLPGKLCHARAVLVRKKSLGCESQNKLVRQPLMTPQTVGNELLRVSRGRRNLVGKVTQHKATNNFFFSATEMIAPLPT